MAVAPQSHAQALALIHGAPEKSGALPVRRPLALGLVCCDFQARGFNLFHVRLHQRIFGGGGCEGCGAGYGLRAADQIGRAGLRGNIQRDHGHGLGLQRQTTRERACQEPMRVHQYKLR